ncbi:MAG: 3-deoxy-7-phosphoheptulonate synthase class II [Actinomycetota bacterium]|mgnify:FL=1|nr:3-deoxy-7-phosphoheptulonate synthase class II [Actinomycetota bacterium]MEC8118905.1 3-deoxy-7-phosphoheptulonate synthase class II [Actinomycetota bacterium]
MTSNWNPNSWTNFAADQQPDWPDDNELNAVLKEISELPPLVFAGEARTLKSKLARVCNGEALLLQAGDCAESFSALSANSIRDKLKVILQMAVALTYSTGLPVVKVGRIAGQFAKPRSSPTETKDDLELPSFRGHIVNDTDFNAGARTANPKRLLMAYNQSSATLNLLRAFTSGGFADLTQVHSWNQQFVANSPAGAQYKEIADGITNALAFMRACGITSEDHPALHEVDFYTSHEALLLGYEEALTRNDSMSGDWYDCSAHMLWIGERTRRLDGAHIEFLRGVENPLGCKLGPTATTEDAIKLCEILNPKQIPGRLTFITRMGASVIDNKLPELVGAVQDSDHPVVWACDPMHGNTYTAESGLKTRNFSDVVDETKKFFHIHRSIGTWAGGIHVELTGDNVTECVGGAENLSDDDLALRYETMCDPRLNASQSLELAFHVAEELRSS